MFPNNTSNIEVKTGLVLNNPNPAECSPIPGRVIPTTKDSKNGT